MITVQQVEKLMGEANRIATHNAGSLGFLDATIDSIQGSFKRSIANSLLDREMELPFSNIASITGDLERSIRSASGLGMNDILGTVTSPLSYIAEETARVKANMLGAAYDAVCHSIAPQFTGALNIFSGSDWIARDLSYMLNPVWEHDAMEVANREFSKILDPMNGLDSLARFGSPNIGRQALAEAAIGITARWPDPIADALQALERSYYSWGEEYFRPGTRWGDFYTLDSADKESRIYMEALERTAKRISWMVFDRPTFIALCQRAESNGQAVETTKLEILKVAIVLVIGLLEHKQKIRLGKDWIVDEYGKQALIAPTNLPDDDLWEWFTDQACKAARADLLEEPYPAPTKDVYYADGAERGGRLVPIRDNAPILHSDFVLDDTDPLQNFLSQEGTTWALGLIDASLPERGRVLRRVADLWLVQGLDNSEIASDLNLEQGTVRFHQHRIRTMITSYWKKASWKVKR